MWSANQAYDIITDASEEFFNRLGFQYSVNLFRVLCTFTSYMRLVKGKFPHPLSNEMSVIQLTAVALTLTPWEYGLQIVSVGLMSAMLGVMVTVAPDSIGMNVLYYFLMNLVAAASWHAGVSGIPGQITQTYTRKEFELKCVLAGFVIGLYHLYGRCRVWYTELVAAQDKAEAENNAKIASKKSK